MIPLLTPGEMQAADRRTIAAGTPEPILMERAGRAVAWEVRQCLGGSYGRRVVVVCGKGNNGGDGRIAARVLSGWGVRVDVVDLASVDDSMDDAINRRIQRADCVVDAMFGTGFRGVLDGAAAAIVHATDASAARVVAVDIPSGIDGVTGAAAGPVVSADHTVTFAAPKPGLWFFPGRANAGRVTVADIGIDLGPDVGRTGVVEAEDVGDWIRPRPDVTHKWEAAVLVVGGSGGMTGAPMLTAHAAMRAGAGMVWAAMPGEAARRASGSEVITRAVADDGTGTMTPGGAGDLLERVGEDSRFGSVVVGPGLGRSDGTVEAVRALVVGTRIPLVLDADGLTAVAGRLDVLSERSAPTVLTPHDGEFARLRGAPVGDDRIAAARALAVDTGCVVLLKGPTTVTAHPDGRVLLNPTGTSALATAGTGDVLSGIIGAFIAEGTEPLHAAAAAAYVHGRAAGPGGHTGLLAGDLPEAVARVLHEIVERRGTRMIGSPELEA